jgi:hypothetical protein
MEQGRAARDVAPVEVWGEGKGKAEVEWVAHLPRGRAEIVYAPSAGTRPRILLHSPAIKKAALNVVRE